MSVHPRSLGSLVRTLGVVGFIRGRCVHSRAQWGSFGLSGVVVSTRTYPGGRCIHPMSLGSLSRALRVIQFTRARSWGRSDHPES